LSVELWKKPSVRFSALTPMLKPAARNTAQLSFFIIVSGRAEK
jgi:hypothetical protein